MFELPRLDQALHVELTRPFPVKNIKWRVGSTTQDKSKGMALAYVDARDVMQRLDQVIGPAFWQATYPKEGCCELSIRVADACGNDCGFVTKSNCAGETDVEGEKGQASDAFKRAAVLWGIGRYLYYLPQTWVPLVPSGRSYRIDTPPALPEWALPENWSNHYVKMFLQ